MKTILISATFLSIALALGGCGRKAPLDPPPANSKLYGAVPAKPAPDAKDENTVQPAPAPDRKFILDPLL